MSESDVPVFRSVPKIFTGESAAFINSTRPRYARSYQTGEIVDVAGNPHYEKIVAAHQLRVNAKIANGEVVKHLLLPIKCVTTYELEMLRAETKALREAELGCSGGIYDLRYEPLPQLQPPPPKARHLRLVKS